MVGVSMAAVLEEGVDSAAVRGWELAEVACAVSRAPAVGSLTHPASRARAPSPTRDQVGAAAAGHRAPAASPAFGPGHSGIDRLQAGLAAVRWADSPATAGFQTADSHATVSTDSIATASTEVASIAAAHGTAGRGMEATADHGTAATGAVAAATGATGAAAVTGAIGAVATGAIGAAGAGSDSSAAARLAEAAGPAVRARGGAAGAGVVAGAVHVSSVLASVDMAASMAARTQWIIRTIRPLTSLTAVATSRRPMSRLFRPE